MRIYFIGNSFTFFNDLPAMMAAELGCEVGRNLRGGAFLHDRLNPADELHTALHRDLQENWDYVILQEQSRNAFADAADYHASVDALCALIREHGAAPILYETWAYRNGSEKLASTGLTWDEMQAALTRETLAAAERSRIPLAPVGQAFHASAENLLLEDDFHPNERGTRIACDVLCQTIRQLQN